MNLLTTRIILLFKNGLKKKEKEKKWFDFLNYVGIYLEFILILSLHDHILLSFPLEINSWVHKTTGTKI